VTERATFLITRKDLRLRVRDRSVFILGILAPFAIAFVLRLVIGNADDFTADYAVVDLDGGPIASAFVEVVESLEEQTGIEVRTDVDEDDVDRLIEDDELDAAFVIPEGFSDAATSPEPLDIRVVGNVDSQIATQIATSVGERFASNLNAVRLSVAAAAAPGATPEQLTALGEAAQAADDPVVVGTIESENRQLDATTYLMAGMAVFFVFFLVQFGVTGLLDEREQGTLARLLAAPVSRLSIPLAKMLTSIILGFVAMGVLAVASTLLMGANWGNPVGVALLIVGVVLAAAGIMAVVAGVANTAEQAGNVQAIIAVLLGMIGGSFFPVAQGEGVLSRLAVITPHHWFLRGLGDLSGGGVAAVFPALAALMVFAAACGAIGLVMLNRKVSL
jgi:ABC-2 type transport system permease protein